MDDLISRTWLLAEYDKRHKGPPGGARKLIEEAPPALGTNLAEVGTDLIRRQQAIEAFNTDVDTLIVYGTENAKAVEHYLNGVIEKIKQLPPAQPTFDARDTQYNLPIGTDLISRQAAIEAVQNRHMMLSKEKVLLINDLEKLPSAEPKRIKGRWIEILSMNHTYKCSECGRLLVNVTDGKNNVSKHYPYCHCGAKMEE